MNSTIDIVIFIVYMIAMLGVGVFFLNKNKSVDDYYVGGRSISSWHIGLSVVATDVGGGFSIGLGGLGFVMGISGSWMLFTGLIGAWLSAVFLIPKVKKLDSQFNMLTFPQFFLRQYGPKAALAAGLISAIGYLGFTSSQMLAGAKLASATFDPINLNQALIIMGIIAVVYTVMGGLKAVIYTDTIQWIILMSGLIFIGLPVAYFEVGGWSAIKEALPAPYFSFSNLDWQDLFNWFITIVPIWFVGMTLYQRIYASRSEKEAKKAWFIAGIFEWPIMALMGVLLGMLAKVAWVQGILDTGNITTLDGFDSEMGLPLLLKNVLPVGLLGLMMSAYFSAILSTADSCLMASSGNVVSDILGRYIKMDHKREMRISQLVTLLLGATALILAATMTNVLDLMLYSYAFMVSGLFIPVVANIFFNSTNEKAATASMILGGATTLLLGYFYDELPFDLDANAFGISISILVFILISKFLKTPKIT